MIVDFDVTGTCPTCDAPVTGIAVHNAYIVRRAWRVADDGVIGWAICPAGCTAWRPPPVATYVRIRTRLKVPA